MGDVTGGGRAGEPQRLPAVGEYLVGVLAPAADGRAVGQDRTASPEGLAGSEDVLAECGTERMFRDRLRRAGLPEFVAAPTEPENFLAVMESGLRTYGLPLLDEMLTDSLLVDLGYVDADALSRARDHAERTPAVPDLLCDTLALEVGLRSLA